MLAVLGCSGWVAFQGLQAKSALESAQTSALALQTAATSLNVTAASDAATQFETDTRQADEDTSDPLFVAAENVPFVGPNLKALQQVSATLDGLSTNAVAPALAFANTLSVNSLRPVNGKLNVAVLAQASSTIGTVQSALTAATASAEQIDTSSTVPEIGTARSQLVNVLSKATGQLGKAQSSIVLAQDLLGVNGPRHYLLGFLNNAETTALGGGPAALSMVTVDNGTVSMTASATSGDFPLNDGPARAMDQNLLNIYSPGIASTLNWSTSRPDFPTAALTMKAFWEKYEGGTVDGVITIDPIALSDLLTATGPMTLASGDVLNTQNAVTLLLHDIYLRYPEADIEKETNPFFTDTAKTVFAGLTRTTADPGQLLTAVNKAIQSGDLLAWSANTDEENLMTGSRLQGVLPTDNTKSTLVGTYFRDVSVSKTDYWLHTNTALTTDVCTNHQNPTFAETVTLHSSITPEEANTLPYFVVGGNFRGKKFSTEVYVYGPVGATLTSATAGTTSVEADVRTNASDLGRPVSRFLVDLAPGETNTITATFTGSPGSYGTPVTQGTPMMNTTTQTLTAPSCPSK
ncbi:DUF4012 domain-containing protein [Subtercola sp. RTI3]|uniref:DUF4012 domain-containing protein n=1 Tax=Subtercola sp. RTI3 TaxID=3048639 RepID=UPI002B22EDB3|nr:DUF4012 domain-containing protein [Subtercola sp. RTI3]MEA9984271.1 DUF4012 domain-containing protein [Subtercola sp. RTI3]